MMIHDFNVLPEERTRALRRKYFVRLGVVALVCIAVLVAAHGVMLFPSYIALQQAAAEKEIQVAALSERLGSSQDEITTRAAALKENAVYLARLAKTPSASGDIRAILAQNRPDVRITDISFAAPTGTSGKAAVGKIVVSGVAATREALRAYNVALSGLPFITKADLPVSAYARDTDISFSITLSGPLTP